MPLGRMRTAYGMTQESKCLDRPMVSTLAESLARRLVVQPHDDMECFNASPPLQFATPQRIDSGATARRTWSLLATSAYLPFLH